MRLADAEKVKRKIKYIARTYGTSESTKNKLLNAVDDSIVDAAPVRHGRLVNSNNPCYFEFSCCGAKVDKTITLKFDYCYHCGAKMDGGEDTP